MRVIPLLRFNGQAAEAFAFYARVLGGQITACLRYADLTTPGDTAVPDHLRAHVCHIRLELPGAVLVGADGNAEPDALNPTPIHLEVDSVIEAERLYRALGEGGPEQLPMMETIWAWRWGWMVDRYGMAWMVQCPRRSSAQTGLSAGRTG